MSDTVPDDKPDNGAPDPNLPAWARKQARALDPLTEERLAAFIGPRWPKYLRKFEPFRADPTFVPTWNWSAALFQSAWFLYRKLYLAAFGFMLLPGFVFRLLTDSDATLTASDLQKPENRGLLLVNLGIVISTIIASGGLANWLLFRRARAAARLADLQELPPTDVLPWLQRVGGVNNWGVALAVAVFLMSSYMAMMA